MRRGLKALLTRVVEAGLPANLLEALGPVVSRAPVPWDEAALQFDLLRATSEASGTPNISTDYCAPHEPREQLAFASLPPSSLASPGATGSLLWRNTPRP